MTLNTAIYIKDEINPQEVFRFCQRLVLLHDEGQRTLDDVLTEDDDWGGDSRCLMNRIGQGLPAWLMVKYKPNGMYRTEEERLAHDECNHPSLDYYEPYDEDCDGTGYPHNKPACWIVVDFDTAYGYSNSENGWGCSNLHAFYIGQLGQWLDSKGVAWSWQNEFSGEIHDGYAGLEEFGESGAKAAGWFHNTVVPAILSGELLKAAEE